MTGKMWRKKVLAMTAAAAMAGSLLGGCAGAPDASVKEAGEIGGTAAQESSQEQGKDEEAGGGDAFSFASVSDVTFPLKEKLNLTVFTGTGDGKTQDSYVVGWIEEKTNIHLDFVYDMEGDDAKTKLNLIMTDPSGMPDIFLSTKWTKSEVQSYGEQGLILALNEYLEDAPNWNKLNEESPSRKADLTMSDGNIYTYGTDNECFHCIYQNRMWIYKPWVDQLNDGRMPETTQELYDFLVKVKTQDPNGNGIADEIPMTGYLGGWATDPTVWLINSFVQCNNPISNTNPTIAAGLVVNDGKIEYAVMKDEYREALRYINKLYEEGLLDNQAFTQDVTQCTALLDNEENLVALHPAGFNIADQKNFAAKQDGRWQDWVALDPVEGPDGVRLAARGVTDYFGSCVGSISTSCKYPEIVVALFELLATEEGTNVQRSGPEGYTWRWTEEGTSLGGGTPKYEYINGFNAEEFDWVGNGFDRAYSGCGWSSDGSINCATAEFRAAQRVETPESDIEYILQQAAESYEKYSPDEASLIPNLVFEGQDAQNMSEYTITIGGYVNQAVVQFITGAMDVDKDWEAYIQKLESMGVQDYIALYQSSYDAYMANQ